MIVQNVFIKYRSVQVLCKYPIGYISFVKVSCSTWIKKKYKKENLKLAAFRRIEALIYSQDNVISLALHLTGLFMMKMYGHPSKNAFRYENY